MAIASPAAVLIVGAGIGGLGAALALARSGRPVTVLEQAPAFGEVGAGIQLGPNAVRLLDGWGLGAGLRALAARPQRLQARDAHDGRLLGQLPLGDAMSARYGADYLCVHRADLHGLLLAAMQAAGPAIHTGFALQSFVTDADGVVAQGQKRLGMDQTHRAPVLLGCDGLWSQVRNQLLADGLPRPTGHLAYRALLPISQLPAGTPRDAVTVWLGPRLHVVGYPVRAGEAFNLVAVVHGPPPADSNHPRGWTQASDCASLLAAMPGIHSGLQAVLVAAPAWTRWVLHERSPLQSAQALAQGRVALLGDAAHPMRPYLAQGAAMALEDADALATCLTAQPEHLPLALQHYAQARWRRNAQVQAKAQRNGRLFHAQGPLRWARNLAMRWSGGRVMDTPWLYRDGTTA